MATCLSLYHLSGESLDINLVRFSELAREKRQLFYDKTIAAGSFGSPCKIAPVYVTKAERNRKIRVSV